MTRKEQEERYQEGVDVIFALKPFKGKITTLNQFTIMVSAYIEPGILTPSLTKIADLTGAGLRGRVAHLIKTGMMHTKLRRAQKMGAPLRAHYLTEEGTEEIKAFLKAIRS